MKMMKRVLSAALLIAITGTQTIYAQSGDMGYFGGISQGTRLPSTTEQILQNAGTNRARAESMPYKEMIMLDGIPYEFEGLLTVRRANNAIKPGVDVGTYNETYVVQATTSGDATTNLSRTITFRVNYRIEGNQTIKDYTATTWNETIATPNSTYVLDQDRSQFGVSILEDSTPGVKYYKGNISQTAVYAGGQTGVTTHTTEGSFYGYESAWSNTEVHRIDGIVSNSNWQMQYQVRPSVSVSKRLNYTQNEPTAISFAGNYREIMSNVSGMQYNIFVKPQEFYDVPDSGGTSISTYNTFEQLIAPNVEYLRGHFAESDIRKLFSMQILQGDPKHFQPNQEMLRGQFIMALSRAIKLPVEQPQQATGRNARNAPITIVFPDVTPDRPTYPYIMAAFNAGFAKGSNNGYFYEESPISREEAVAIMLRTLGLTNLGLDNTPITVFTDDYKVSDWARGELSAAHRIGLIYADDEGNINPTDNITKAEAAALINRLIEYMRSDIALDYMDNIVNYPS